MKKFFLFLLLAIFSKSFGETLTVSAAANVQYALDEIITEFNKKYPYIKVEKVVSSSGKLTTQIVRGAPYDIFLSADMKYPQFLYKKGLTAGKPKVYAYGLLVLYSMKNIKFNDIKDLTKPYIKRVAIPNPKIAPYGRASVEALKYYKIYKQVLPKVVYGESVGQATQYIVQKITDTGFTAKSVVLSPKLKGKGKWIEIDHKAYKPIKQGIVILKRAKDKKSVYKFYNFIFSKKGKEILKKYGYRLPEGE